MGIIAICGNRGSGKTLLLVILSKYSKKKIISNFHLSFHYEVFDIDKFLQQKYENCIILLDEAYVYLESRISLSLQNRLSSYILFQSRKKSVDIIMTMQLFKSIDIRFRQLINIYIQCSKINDGFLYEYYNVDTNILNSKILTFENAQPFYKMYDTNEIITDERMQESIQTQEEKNTIIEDYANIIIKNHTSKKKINLNEVKLFCFKNEIDKSLCSVIFAQIKEIEQK